MKKINKILILILIVSIAYSCKKDKKITNSSIPKGEIFVNGELMKINNYYIYYSNFGLVNNSNTFDTLVGIPTNDLYLNICNGEIFKKFFNDSFANDFTTSVDFGFCNIDTTQIIGSYSFNEIANNTNKNYYENKRIGSTLFTEKVEINNGQIINSGTVKYIVKSSTLNIISINDNKISFKFETIYKDGTVVKGEFVNYKFQLQ